MARIRTIKPEFFSHEELASKSAHARLLAIGLLTLADCEGRLRWVPMQVHSQVFPWEASVNIEVLLGELIEVGYVIHYEAEGKRYVEVINFRKHQRLSGKEAGYTSRLPAPPENALEIAVKTGETQGNHSGASPGSIGNPLGTGEQGNNRNRGTIGTVSISSEPDKPASKQVVELRPEDCKFPVFPCSGKGAKTWQATDLMLEEWREAFPAVEVDAELRKAHSWIKSNLRSRKTANGMAAFINGWLTRNQDRGGHSNGNGRRPAPLDSRNDQSVVGTERGWSGFMK